MNLKRNTVPCPQEFIETLAGRLTSAAYAVVLRHGRRESWLELQLELWRALTQSVQESADKMLSSAPTTRDRADESGVSSAGR